MSILQAVYHWWQAKKIKAYLTRVYKAVGNDKDVVESSPCRGGCKCKRKDT